MRWPKGRTALGPAPAPIAPVQGRHRWRFLAKAEREAMQKFLRSRLKDVKPREPLALQVDMDPYGFLWPLLHPLPCRLESDVASIVVEVLDVSDNRQVLSHCDIQRVLFGKPHGSGGLIGPRKEKSAGHVVEGGSNRAAAGQRMIHSSKIIEETQACLRTIAADSRWNKRHITTGSYLPTLEQRSPHSPP